MKAIAVKQAKDRLEYAREAVNSLHEVKSSKQFGRAWNEFLTNIDAIYEKLRNGAESNRASKAQFERLKHARKNDELLRYLNRARNSDLHGLEESREEIINAPVLENVSDSFDLSTYEKKRGEMIIKIPVKNGGKPVVLKAKFSSTVRLVPVKARDGTIVPLPTNFLGTKIPSMSIPELASWVLRFFEGIVAEAEKMVK